MFYVGSGQVNQLCVLVKQVKQRGVWSRWDGWLRCPAFTECCLLTMISYRLNTRRCCPLINSLGAKHWPGQGVFVLLSFFSRPCVLTTNGLLGTFVNDCKFSLDVLLAWRIWLILPSATLPLWKRLGRAMGQFYPRIYSTPDASP